jgi:hypothetical protein
VREQYPLHDHFEQEQREHKWRWISLQERKRVSRDEDRLETVGPDAADDDDVDDDPSRRKKAAAVVAGSGFARGRFFFVSKGFRNVLTLRAIEMSARDDPWLDDTVSSR